MDGTGSGEGDAMIRLSGLGKTYDDGTVAVQDVDLTVRRGELVSSSGRRGAASPRR